MPVTGNVNDFGKEFFQNSWGPDGYYENFSYGVGIDKVCEIALNPFFRHDNTALEIGPGGGVFTERMSGNFKHLTAIDVIPKPAKFSLLENFTYIELYDKNYDCGGVLAESMDFAFSYNCFCHLSNDAIKHYLRSVNRVLRVGGNFVFMVSSYGRDLPASDLGSLLPMGHFCQDERTLALVIGDGWEVMSQNMIPKHRDIIVHLKKI